MTEQAAILFGACKRRKKWFVPCTTQKLAILTLVFDIFHFILSLVKKLRNFHTSLPWMIL